MKAKKLFLAFVFAFSLALAGGGVFSAHASEQCAVSRCGPCSFQAPVCNGGCQSWEGRYPSHALAWQQFYNY